jgi:hypothetical protein
VQIVISIGETVNGVEVVFFFEAVFALFGALSFLGESRFGFEKN